VALTYILEPATLGEQKSKAAQLGIKRLMECGVQPHVIACRATNPVGEKVMQKIGMFSNVPMKRIFSMHDRDSIYVIPDAMRTTGLDREILSILNLHDRVDVTREDVARRGWNEFSAKLASPRSRRVKIGVMGKYASLRDAYASIDKAIEHCGIHLNAAVELHWLDTSALDSAAKVAATLKDMDGIIVPGGFGQRGVEGKIRCVEHARTTKLPFLGICLGFQMAVIEYARNVLGLRDANSTEFDPATPHAFISELPDQKKLEGIVGGTMRLGGQDVQLDPESFASKLYGATTVRERFRHRYEVEPNYIDALQSAGLHFSGRHTKHPIMQVLELGASDHPCFIAAQFHPELTSRPLHPQPLFMGLVAAAIVRKHPDAAREPAIAHWLNTGSPVAAH
jgi:CTP synthase